MVERKRNDEDQNCWSARILIGQPIFEIYLTDACHSPSRVLALR